MGLMSRPDVQAQVRKQHKFKVGQMVDYAPSRTGMSASSRGYKIVRLLPREGVDILYRIKSAGETFERVAKEQDLTFRTAPSLKQRSSRTVCKSLFHGSVDKLPQLLTKCRAKQLTS